MQVDRQSQVALPPQRALCERGMVLIYAVFGLMVVLGIVAAGSLRGGALEKSSFVEFQLEGRARQVAESGIVDGIAWLRSRTSQPVTDFEPRRDMSLNPPVDETDEEGPGLVREFEIARGYWGRYVVRRAVEAEAFKDSNGNGYFDPEEDFDDADGDGRRDVATGSRDVSSLRGVPKFGTVWYLESEGSIYRMVDPGFALGQGPNTRLAKMVVGCEVRRLTAVIPASAAIVIAKGRNADLQGTYVNSPVLGIAHRNRERPRFTARKNDPKRVAFDAPARHAQVPGWRTSGVGGGSWDRIRVEDIFGVSMETLKAMADYNVESLAGIGESIVDPVIEEVAGVLKRHLPYTFPDGAFVIITPPAGKDVVFDRTQSLIGRGVVVVNGNLIVREDSNTDFAGILYVTGNMSVDRSGAFDGITIVGDRLTVRGTLAVTRVPSTKSRKTRKTWKSGKTLKSRRSHKRKSSRKSKRSMKSLKVFPEESSWFGHKPDLVDELVALLGRYRRWKSSFRPVPVLEDGRPDEHFRTGGTLVALQGAGK